MNNYRTIKTIFQNRFKMKTFYILTIAGHDPSGGAGLTADINTIQNYGLTALSVCTGVTVQNESIFKKCYWSNPNSIKEQLTLLLSTYPIKAIKIGIIENLTLLEELLFIIYSSDPTIKIIWDPILKSGTGYAFHEELSKQKLLNIVKLCYLVTPNYDELKAISKEENIENIISEISSRCHLFLKGGHREDSFKGTDTLYLKNGDSINFHPPTILNVNRHGTGCALSSSITSLLGQGYSLNESCLLAKEYVYRLLLHTNLVTEKKMTLQYISDGETSEEHLKNIQNACVSGVKWIQLRMKEFPEKIVLNTAKNALKICRDHGALLIIDDYVSIAKISGADGVHLGKNDLPPNEARYILGPEFIIGATANTIDDIEDLANKNIDYVGLGPFKYTPTKRT